MKKTTTEKTSRAMEPNGMGLPAATPREQPCDPRILRVKTGLKAGHTDDPHGN